MWAIQANPERGRPVPAGPQRMPAEPRREAGRRRDLILVEDSPADSRLFELRMRARDAAVRIAVARDGSAATDMLNRVIEGALPRPGLLVLDLNLPVLKGWEVLRHIKDSPLLRFIPVLVFSSSRLPQDVERAYAEGAASYIHKGRDLDDFQRAVDAIYEYWCGIVDLP